MGKNNKGMLGSAPAVVRAQELAAMAAPRPDPVLIYGETGTGKGMLAEAIHQQSGRKGAFVSVNCATFNPNLIESHLFGYVKGAFTGADKDTPGLFETAQNGTLFLDEIADTPLEVQPRLLRALEEGLIRRVGGRNEIPIDVRLICATHTDLRERIGQGRFREDLFYRINAFIITLPPLRSRVEDIAELAAHFLAVFEPGSPRRLSAAALDALKRYSWPGNVRELRSALAFALAARPARADQLEIQVEDLPDAVVHERAPKSAGSIPAVKGPGGAARLFTELYTRHPENARAWAQFLIALQAELKSVRFGRHDILPMLRAARGPQPSDSALINEWQRRIKPLGISLGLISEASKKMQINLDRCQETLATDDFSARPTAVVTAARRVPSNRLNRTNIPPPRTSFIGRNSELDELQRMLREVPALVTLTGPGGSGKTRLAQEIGAKFVDRLSGGAWFADVTEARNAEGVAFAVAQALRVPLSTHEPPEYAVARILQARGDMLIILDNFEQVADAAMQTVGLWAKHAQNVRFLTTSRAVLGLEGERVKEIRPLSVPPREEARTLSRQAAEKFDAVRLFVDRAQLANLSFDLDEKNAPSVAEICAVLEGLPLAVELAAARISIMKPEQMVPRLHQKFELLRSARRDLNERQRSLLGTIDWSYQLLNESERAVFEQLSVFKGGFYLEAAEAILELPAAAGKPGVMDAIQSLRDKSLLFSYDTASETRFALYDAIADFAALKLSESADSARQGALKRRHARYYAQYSETWDRRIFSGKEIESLDRLSLDLDNLFAAQNYLMERAQAEADDAEAGADTRAWLARACMASAHVMRVRGPAKERVPRLARAIAAMGPGDSEQKGRLLAVLAHAQSDCGDWKGGEQSAAEALQIARRENSKSVEALALMQRGWLLASRGESDVAKELYEQALPILVELGDRRNEARTIGRLGYLAARDGEIERGFEMLSRAEKMLEEEGDRFGLGFQLITRGNIELRRGAYADALNCMERAERQFRQLGDKRSVAQCLGNRGLLLKLLRDYQGSLRCSEECQNLAREVGDLTTIATDLSNRGHVLVDLDQLADAFACFKAAEQRQRDLNNQPLIAVALENQAWILANQGNLAEALEKYAQAEALVHGRDAVIHAGIKVSKCESLIDAGQAAQAHGAVKEALSEFEARRTRDRDYFKALVAAARCEHGMGNRKGASDLAARAMELAKELGYSPQHPAKRIQRDLERLAQLL